MFKCCEDVVARRVTIDSNVNHNNDGFDIEARNVLIEDCDSGSLLASVLQGVEAEINHLCGVLNAINSEYTHFSTAFTRRSMTSR